METDIRAERLKDKFFIDIKLSLSDVAHLLNFGRVSNDSFMQIQTEGHMIEIVLQEGMSPNDFRNKKE